jgi:hypothetical protein
MIVSRGKTSVFRFYKKTLAVSVRLYRANFSFHAPVMLMDLIVQGKSHAEKKSGDGLESPRAEKWRQTPRRKAAVQALKR